MLTPPVAATSRRQSGRTSHNTHLAMFRRMAEVGRRGIGVSSFEHAPPVLSIEARQSSSVWSGRVASRRSQVTPNHHKGSPSSVSTTAVFLVP